MLLPCDVLHWYGQGMTAEHLTEGMIKVLHALGGAERPLLPSEVGRAAEIRHTRGSYMGQRKTFGVGSAGAAIATALVRRGLAEETWLDYCGENRRGWQITEAGFAKLSEVSESMPA